MRCYLVRHAQTLWNTENRLQGHSNSPLTPLGREQAKRLREYFAGRPIRALYTSHLQRSVETAQAIAHGMKLSVAVDPGLAEIHFGPWEGLTAEEIDARFGGAYGQWHHAPSHVPIPGAESFESFRARVRRTVGQILSSPVEPHGQTRGNRSDAPRGANTPPTCPNRHSQRGPRPRPGPDGGVEGDIVIVTHGGVIAALLADWLGASFDQLLRRLALDNAGVTGCHYRMTPPHVLWVNDTRHLIVESTLPTLPPPTISSGASGVSS